MVNDDGDNDDQRDVPQLKYNAHVKFIHDIKQPTTSTSVNDDDTDDGDGDGLKRK